jgi:hypothetical protein
MENNTKDKMKQILAVQIGMILLALSVIVTKYFPSTAFFDFFSGLLLGLSLVLNSYYIIITSKKLKDK